MAEDKSTYSSDIDLPFHFKRKPMPIAAELRPDWKMAALLLILQRSSARRQEFAQAPAYSELGRSLPQVSRGVPASAEGSVAVVWVQRALRASVLPRD